MLEQPVYIDIRHYLDIMDTVFRAQRIFAFELDCLSLGGIMAQQMKIYNIYFHMKILHFDWNLSDIWHFIWCNAKREILQTVTEISNLGKNWHGFST